MNDDLLVSYLAGECTQEQEEEILAWIRESEDNRRHLADLSALWHAVRRPEEGEAMFSLLSGFSGVDSKIKRQESRRGSLRKWLPIAAGIAAVFVCGFFFAARFPGKHPAVPADSYVWFNPDSSAMQITLPDQSQVWLGSNTSLTYSAGESGRLASLKGEAFFDVSKDPSRAFIVKTPDLRIKVYGTRFNVRSLPSETFSEVSLVEGSVSLADNSERNIIFLTPGQQAKYVAEEEFLQVSEVPVDNILLVRYGVESLKDMTLPEIVSALSVSFGRELRILACPDVNERYTVNYPKDAALEDVIWTVETLSGGKIEIVNQENAE